MATPLSLILNGLRSDTDMRLAFQHEPAGFLLEHGWGELDPADMQEAMLVLADATPPVESATWAAGADAFAGIGGTGADATALGLGSALQAMGDEPIDPDVLDEIADTERSDDGPDDPDTDTTAADTTDSDTTDSDDVETADAGTGTTGTETDDAGAGTTEVEVLLDSGLDHLDAALDTAALDPTPDHAHDGSAPFTIEPMPEPDVLGTYDVEPDPGDPAPGELTDGWDDVI